MANAKWISSLIAMMIFPATMAHADPHSQSQMVETAAQDIKNAIGGSGVNDINKDGALAISINGSPLLSGPEIIAMKHVAEHLRYFMADAGIAKRILTVTSLTREGVIGFDHDGVTSIKLRNGITITIKKSGSMLLVSMKTEEGIETFSKTQDLGDSNQPSDKNNQSPSVGVAR